MARGSQTFQKRQRENKLREKAQQKRERREQRKNEKRQLLSSNDQPATPPELQTAGSGAPTSELGGGGQ
jgi:hypothetical protein